MQYGSAGFSTHGYHAGCAYGRANGARVLEDPATNRWLCEPDAAAACGADSCLESVLRTFGDSDLLYRECLDNKPPACTRCLEDYSGTGTCRQTRLDNGFVFPKPVRTRFCV